MYEIFAYLQAGLKKVQIARQVNVDRSTIHREIERNKDMRSGRYNPELAQRKRDARMHGRNHFKKMDDTMKALVVSSSI